MSEAELRWILQHKRRWPLHGILVLAAMLGLWCAAVGRGQQQALQDRPAVDEALASLNKPGRPGVDAAWAELDEAIYWPDRDHCSWPDYHGQVHKWWRLPEGFEHRPARADDPELAGWDEEDRPTVHSFVELTGLHQAVLDRLDPLLAEEDPGWQIDNSQGLLAINTDYIGWASNLRNVIRLRMLCAARQDDWDEVFHCVERLLQLSRYCRQTPTMISWLVGTSVESLAIDAFVDCLHVAEKPLGDQAWHRLRTIAKKQQSVKTGLSQAMHSEGILLQWGQNFSAAPAPGKAGLWQRLGGGLSGSGRQMEDLPQVMDWYPTVYAQDRAFGLELFTELAPTWERFDRPLATLHEPALLTERGRRLESAVYHERDLRHLLTYMLIPACDLALSKAVELPLRWRLLVVAAACMRARGQGQDIFSASFAADELDLDAADLVDPSSPDAEPVRFALAVETEHDYFSSSEADYQVLIITARGWDKKFKGDRGAKDPRIMLWQNPWLRSPPSEEEAP